MKLTFKLSWYFSLFSVIFILLTSGSVIKAQTAEKLDELSLEDLLNMQVDVASSKGESIFNTPSTVSVIDKEMIQLYNLKSVTDAVNLIAGFNNTRTYLKRNVPTSRGVLQDNYANKVLVMINGVSSWHAVTGEGNLDRVNINDVERIEVLKGPASVQYGTNAYSGAVNIVLKKNADKNTSLHFGVGERGMFEGGGNFYYSKDDYRVFVSGNSSVETGHDYKYTDEKGVTGHLNEYIKSSNFNFALGYKGHSLLLNTYKVDESYLGVVPAFASGAGKNHELTGILANYSFNHIFSDAVEFKSNTSYDWNHRDLSRSSDDYTRAVVNGYRVFAGGKFIVTPSDMWNFELGGDFDSRTSLEYSNVNPVEDKVLEENNMKNKSVSEYSLYGQARFIYNPFNVLAGVRYSNNNLFGSNISSRASLVYTLNEKNSFKLIYGTSYRAPSLFELYFATATFTVFGNENLEPELSNSIELAYLTSFDKFFVQILGYHATYENKIFRTLGDVVLPDGTVLNNKSIYDNGSVFKANGLELEVKYKNSDLVNCFVNYRYLDGDNGDEIDNNNNYNFKYVPQHTVSLGISKALGKVNLSGIFNYLGKTEGPIAPIDAQYTIDADISYTQGLAGLTIRHSLSAKDLTDEFVMVPEYVRRGKLNEVPLGFGRRISYTLTVGL